MDIEPLTDREAVADAIRAHGAAWQAAYDDILPAEVLSRVTVEPTDEDIDEWLARLPSADDLGVALGVSVSGAVRGYIYVRWTETKDFVDLGEAGLKEIYVHPDYWGAGLGTTLLGAAFERLPPEIDGVALETLAENEVGRNFYESRGFRADGRGESTIGEQSYETVIYRRER